MIIMTHVKFEVLYAICDREIYGSDSKKETQENK